MPSSEYTIKSSMVTKGAIFTEWKNSDTAKPFGNYRYKTESRQRGRHFLNENAYR